MIEDLSVASSQPPETQKPDQPSVWQRFSAQMRDFFKDSSSVKPTENKTLDKTDDDVMSRRDMLKLTAAAATGVAVGTTALTSFIVGAVRSQGSERLRREGQVTEVNMLKQLTRVNPFQSSPELGINYLVKDPTRGVWLLSESIFIRSEKNDLYEELFKKSKYAFFLTPKTETEYQLISEPGMEPLLFLNLDQIWPHLTDAILELQKKLPASYQKELRIQVDRFSMKQYIESNPGLAKLYQDFQTQGIAVLKADTERLVMAAHHHGDESFDLKEASEKIETLDLADCYLNPKIFLNLDAQQKISPSISWQDTHITSSDSLFRIDIKGEAVTAFPSSYVNSYFNAMKTTDVPNVKLQASWQAFRTAMETALSSSLKQAFERESA